MKVLDGVAYRLLNKTNLTEEKEQLVRANVKELMSNLKSFLLDFHLINAVERQLKQLNLNKVIPFMLKILQNGSIMKMFFTVNQLLKILCETARTVAKKEKDFTKSLR